MYNAIYRFMCFLVKTVYISHAYGKKRKKKHFLQDLLLSRRRESLKFMSKTFIFFELRRFWKNVNKEGTEGPLITSQFFIINFSLSKDVKSLKSFLNFGNSSPNNVNLRSFSFFNFLICIKACAGTLLYKGNISRSLQAIKYPAR